jgi:hypothetical protein
MHVMTGRERLPNRRASETFNLKIEHAYTCIGVRPRFDEHRIVIDWEHFPVPPDRSGHWRMFDYSLDDKIGWRRVTLRGEGSA